MIQTPVYYPFFDAISQNGRVIVENNLILEDGQYKINFEDFEKQCKHRRLKIFLLCNPHNPVGRVWTREELKKMGEICLKYNILIISDGEFNFPRWKVIPKIYTATCC